MVTIATQQQGTFLQPVNEGGPKQAGGFLDYTARSNMTWTRPLASPSPVPVKLPLTLGHMMKNIALLALSPISDQILHRVPNTVPTF